jgi:ribonuclease-3
MDRKLSKKRRAELTALAKTLGVEFSNLALLDEALTHTSYANELKHKGINHNERLEFLGDAVLELATSTYLFHHFPDKPEGDLTKARASVVCSAALARRAKELDFGSHLLLGHGEAETGGGQRQSTLEDTFEAVIGAIYLDRGWETARQYVVGQLSTELHEVDLGENLQDYKTILQEVVQKQPNHKIAYELLAESGPPHCKCFELAVRIDDSIYGTGQGRSKKEAEQCAARMALQKLQN